MNTITLDHLVIAAEAHCMLLIGCPLIEGVDDLDLWLRNATDEQKLAAVHDYLMETC